MKDLSKMSLQEMTHLVLSAKMDLDYQTSYDAIVAAEWGRHPYPTEQSIAKCRKHLSEVTEAVEAEIKRRGIRVTYA